jgi:hypothetical protein
MQFYFNGDFKHIDNSALFDLEYPSIPQGVSTIFVLNRVPGNVNIFIGNGLSSGNSGFYTGSADIIYMDKRYVNSNDVILAHELGHFFSLPHTFLGWEDTEYNIEEPTPTEVFRGSTSYDVEYVDREKNCEVSGDFFCGTPADYITNWNGGCDYTGGAVDPDSVLLDPDETNVMSYYSFSGCEQFIFAEDQTEAMLADFESRSEFNGTNIGLQESVEEPVSLVSPENDEEVAFNGIKLSWEAAENATLYIVEVSRIPTLFALDERVITRELSTEIMELKTDKKYYWRVEAFNETNLCERPLSEIRTFKSVEQVSGLNEIESEYGFKIFPNPSSPNQRLSFDSKVSLSKVKLTVYNSAGALVRAFTKNISTGVNPLAELDGLGEGLYILALQNQEMSKQMKFLIN